MTNRGTARQLQREQHMFAQTYDQLRAIARSYFRGKCAGHTLQPTILVHEAFMRLMQRAGPWRDRNHFIALASVAMRQILIDYARRRHANKRGGCATQVALNEGFHVACDPWGRTSQSRHQMVDVLALGEALTQLAALRPRQAQIVELRYFVGLTVVEVASVLDLSRQTVENEWRHARAWLHMVLTRAA